MRRCQTSLCICLLWRKSDDTECCPLGCLRASSGAVPHAALPTPGLARKCCWAWLQGSPSLANLTRPGFNLLIFQGFGLLVYAGTTLAFHFDDFFFLSSSPSCGRSIIRFSQSQPCYMDLTQVNSTPLPLTAPSPCLQEGLLAAAFVTEPAD